MKVKAMTNVECLMTKERRNPNGKTYCAALASSSNTRNSFVRFVLCHSDSLALFQAEVLFCEDFLWPMKYMKRTPNFSIHTRIIFALSHDAAP